MNLKITCFEDLFIWQKAQELAEKIYNLAETNKYIQKDFSLKRPASECGAFDFG